MKVLAYHRINNVDTDPLTVNTEPFLRQLDWLEEKGFNFISPEHLTNLPLDKTSSVLLTFDHAFRSHYEVIYPLLKAKNYTAIFFLTVDFIGQRGMLTFEEARDLASHGFGVGSHTFSHPHLCRLPLTEAEREIKDSKSFLEDRIGNRVDFFAYPYGEFNEEIIGIVREAGFKAAFLTARRFGKIKSAQFTIPRCGIYQGTNFLLFRLKIS